MPPPRAGPRRDDAQSQPRFVSRVTASLGIVASAALLVWPAWLNGYPLLFSDSGAFLHQTIGPLMIWDKPWIYGPILHAFHWRVTLWLPLIAQGLLMAWLLAVSVRAVLGRARPWLALALAGFAAFLTTAPFTVALLMPDLFAPATVLSLFLLGMARDRLERGEALALGAIATIGIAAHLAHLPLAAALVVLTLLLTRGLRALSLARAARATLRVALPLLAAMALLVATNWVGHGRASLSPHGAIFLLARLQADGPAAATIRARCPAAGWEFCAFADRLPMDANDFLWSPASPLNRDAAGRARHFGGALLSAEAGAIVAATIRDAPLAVAIALARNTLRQLLLIEAGDTLGPDHLAAAVRPRIAEGFSASELAGYDNALQSRGVLPAAVAPFLAPHRPVLIAALALAPLALWWAWRAGDGMGAALLLFVLLGCLANAFATGALSAPTPRYGARIAWLLPIAVVVAFLPLRRRVA